MSRLIGLSLRRPVQRVSVFAAAFAIAVGSLPYSALPAAAGNRVGIDDFMAGLACVESGGSYDAVNVFSGAYGKYQIMPRIWRAWASRYIGNWWADPTPRSQEFVARSRIADLYDLHHRWPLVAHWWLTGNADPQRELWSRGSTGYVDRVITLARLARSPKTADQVPAACFVRNLRPPRVRTEPLPRVEVSVGRAHLREGYGVESRAIGFAKQGTVLAVLGVRRDANGERWLHVGLRDGTKAWIAAWLTQPRSS